MLQKWMKKKRKFSLRVRVWATVYYNLHENNIACPHLGVCIFMRVLWDRVNDHSSFIIAWFRASPGSLSQSCSAECCLISMSHHVPCFTDHLFQISKWNDFSQVNMLLNLKLELNWSKLKKLTVYICVCTLTINMKNEHLNALWWFYCRISMFPVQNKPIFPEHYWKINQIHKSLLLLYCRNSSL